MTHRDSAMRRRTSRIRVLTGFALAAGLLATAILLHYREMRRNDLAEATRLVRASVERIRSATMVWLHERQNDARDLSDFAASESNVFVPSTAQARGQGDAAADLERALRIATRAYGYSDVRALGLDGRVLASVDGIPLTADERAMARESAATGAVLTGITRAPGGGALVTFTAPVREHGENNGNGRIIGVIALTADAATTLGKVVLLEPVGLSTGARRLVLGTYEGTTVLVARRDASDRGWQVGWEAPGVIDSLALAGADTTLALRDAAGRPMIALALPIPGAPIGIARVVPATGVYESANRTAAMEAAAAIAMLAVAGLILELIGVAQRRKLEALLARTIEASPIGVVAVDREYRVKRWNAAAAHIFGWSAEEVIGTPLPIVPDDKREEFRAIQALELSGKPIEALEVTRMTRRGTRIRVQLTTSSIFDEDGNVQEIIGFFTDLSEQRRLEEQLRQSQKMEAVGQLAGGIAHDFNNLLTAIQGHAELVLDALPPGSQERADVRAILAGSARAAALTRQLLAYSRKQLLRPDVLRLTSIVVGVETLLRATLGEDIELVTDVAHDPGSVRADRVQLEQVLLNLAVNARDAMPNGGTLTIRTESQEVTEPFHVYEGDVRPGDYAVLSVSDTGEGMAADVRARIFEPFFTTKEVGKGTGLGLSTVFGIVKQSGGYIAVESAPGRGSTFRVFFPLVATEADSDAEALASASKPRRGTGTILLVEDEEIVRALTARMLERAGYMVIAADSGRAGLRAAREYPGDIDLVLADVVMPGMNGREMANELLKFRPNTRVLYMTGYTDDEILRRGLMESGMEILEKPYTEAVLLEAVGRSAMATPGRGNVSVNVLP